MGYTASKPVAEPIDPTKEDLMSAFKEAQKSMKQDMESGTLWQKHVSDDWEIKKIGPMSGSSKGVLLNYYFCHKKIPEAEKKTVRIVFITGVNADTYTWIKQVASLTKRALYNYEFILLENRGLRDRKWWELLFPGSFVKDMANDAAAVLRHREWLPKHGDNSVHEKFNVVALSMGGMIAQCLAIEYPKHIHSLLLLATGPCIKYVALIRSAFKPFEADFPGQYSVATEDSPLELDEFGKKIAELYESAFVRERDFWKAMNLAKKQLGQPSLLQKRAAIFFQVNERKLKAAVEIIDRSHVKILHGKEDTVIPESAGQTLADIMGVHLHPLAGVGHRIPQVEPKIADQVSEEIETLCSLRPRNT